MSSRRLPPSLPLSLPSFLPLPPSLSPSLPSVTVLADAPAYFLTLVSPDAFLLNEKDRFWRELEGAKAHQLLFEYGESCP